MNFWKTTTDYHVLLGILVASYQGYMIEKHAHGSLVYNGEKLETNAQKWEISLAYFVTSIMGVFHSHYKL